MKTTSDIATEINNEGSTGATLDVINKIIKAVNDSIIRGIITDGEVRFANIGTFTRTERPERMGRNPSTGEAMVIKASSAVKFKASKGLKTAVN